MTPNQKKKKLLINGCSHTRAMIPRFVNGKLEPGDPTAKPWSKLVAKRLDWEPISLAEDGKSNNRIIEETIRYLINIDSVDHVVVQLTDWMRINLYRESHSGKWVPGKLHTQLHRMAGRVVEDYVKIPAASDNDLQVNRFIDTPNQKKYLIQDRELIEPRIIAGTLMNCLVSLCKSKGIGLSILLFGNLGRCIDDVVWSSIPEELFVVKNHRYGVYEHMCWMFETPDTYHFAKDGQEYLADIVYHHIANGERVIVNEKLFKPYDNELDRIFSYD